ncbi:MAG: YceI family protein [Bdellovibrionota bacterium]
MKVFLLTFILAIAVNAADKAKTSAKAVEPIKTIESVKSENIEFKAADGKTEFLAVGKPAMIKINGEAQSAEGTLTAVKNTVNGILTVDLTKLTTKIDLRDDHLKNKYLEVDKFPKATLELVNLELPTEVSKLTDVVTTVPFKGKFTLHGKSSEVAGIANISRYAQIVSAQAEFTFNITDHLDTLPTWLGVKVAESVTVKTNLKGTAK